MRIQRVWLTGLLVLCGVAAQAVKKPYYCQDCVLGVSGKATGFFHVQKNPDGRWWLIDPKGRGFSLQGIGQLRMQGFLDRKVGYSRYARHNEEAYPNKRAWDDETIGRLREWGFNSLGAGCDTGLVRGGLVYTHFLQLSGYCCIPEGDLRIGPFGCGACTAFPNVFSPEFARMCDDVARRVCTPLKDDPNLVGYQLDNELCWWGKIGNRLDEGLFDFTMTLPDTHSAKKWLKTFIGARPVTHEIKMAFLAEAADRYFSVTTAAVRRHDPNHLIMGCRFAGTGGAHDLVWKAAGQYCDVVTVNHYPWADLDRNVILTDNGGEVFVDHYRRYYELCGKPLMMTEWSFSALDTPLPCRNGTGQRFQTQAERARAASLFLRTLMATPFFVGYDYFMWVDFPNDGKSEATNYGLVNESGKPYAELVRALTKVQKTLGPRAVRPMPEPRTVQTEKAPTECERFRAGAVGLAKAVAFRREGDAWSVSNAAGLVLRGTIGKGALVDDIRLGGFSYGKYDGMVETRTNGQRNWMPTDRPESVSFAHEGVCGVVTVTGAGGLNGCRFAVTHRFLIAPTRSDFCAEIVSVENTGPCAIDFSAIYMRPTAACQSPVADEVPPNVWKSFPRNRWRFPDGHVFGLESHDPSASRFHLWTDAQGRQYPDIVFVPCPAFVLKPGAKFPMPQACGARLFLQTAGQQN